MSVEIDLQLATQLSPIPQIDAFNQWANVVLANKNKKITIRLVDEEEMTNYNYTYRKKNKPTNVLAFPFEALHEAQADFLGDIVMCVPVILLEAKSAGLKSHDHFAHLTVHAILHLLGYDHQTNEETQIMQAREIELLKSLTIANPYAHRMQS